MRSTRSRWIFSWRRSSRTCSGTLRDFDVESFDPTSALVPPTDVGEGGLGLRLVRRISDSIRYEYRERSAIITLTKRFPL